MRLLVPFLLFCLCSPFSPAMAFADDKIQIVEKEGEALLGEDTTPALARAQALNNARRAAIEEVTGAQVTGSTVVYNYQVISDLVSSATRGVIVREKLLRDELVKDRYIVKIRAHVKALERRDTGSLRIARESVSRYGGAPIGSGAVFQDNDEIQLRARVSEPAYIHLFSIDKDGLVIKLYPNEYFAGQIVTPGEDFVFPSNKQRDMGLKVRVRTAKNLTRTPETVLFIATRENVNLLGDRKDGEVTVTDLMKEVTDLDSPWTEKVLGYEIRK